MCWRAWNLTATAIECSTHEVQWVQFIFWSAERCSTSHVRLEVAPISVNYHTMAKIRKFLILLSFYVIFGLAGVVKVPLEMQHTMTNARHLLRGARKMAVSRFRGPYFFFNWSQRNIFVRTFECCCNATARASTNIEFKSLCMHCNYGLLWIMDNFALKYVNAS